MRLLAIHVQAGVQLAPILCFGVLCCVAPDDTLANQPTAPRHGCRDPGLNQNGGTRLGG